MSEHIRKLNQDILRQKMLQEEHDRSVSRISVQQTETKHQSSFDMPLAITNAALAPYTARSNNRDLQTRTSPKHDQKLPVAKDGYNHQRGNSLRVRKSPINNDMGLSSQSEREQYSDREEDLRDEGNKKKLFSPSTRAYQFNTYGDSQMNKKQPKLMNRDLAPVQSSDRSLSIRGYIDEKRKESGVAKLQAQIDQMQAQFR